MMKGLASKVESNEPAIVLVGRKGNLLGSVCGEYFHYSIRCVIGSLSFDRAC
jgi:hypothetical protein